MVRARAPVNSALSTRLPTNNHRVMCLMAQRCRRLKNERLSDAERWCFPIGPSSTHTGRARFCGCLALLAHKHEAVFPHVPFRSTQTGAMPFLEKNIS
jgi:hypothetical protein